MEQTIATVVAEGARPAAIVRRISTADLVSALRAGWGDFRAIPTQILFLGLLYPVVGLIAARLATGGLVSLLFPLLAGVSLMGPLVALGLYEISRRRERGEPVSLLTAFAALRSPAIGAILALGGLLFAIFLAWLLAARLIYLATLGTGPHEESLAALIAAAVSTPQGWGLILLGNGAGFLFAALVLGITVVSFPALLDRPSDAWTAVRLSLTVVARNPGPMALWGLIVAGLLVLGALPLLIGLAVVLPVLGHATWHLYRRVVSW
ncbi:MAG: DUF2189 domain-containing protein [Acetobacteraceae bacterium]